MNLGNYIRINEASLYVGMSANTLRNYEKAGMLITYRHPINNYRLYKKEDLDNLLSRVESKQKSYVKKEKGVRFSQDIELKPFRSVPVRRKMSLIRLSDGSVTRIIESAKQVSIDVPDSIHAQVKETACRHKQTIREWVTDLILQALEREDLSNEK